MSSELKPDIYDPEYVKSVFDKCSTSYIRFSYFCSFGFTERWRKQCVAQFKHLPKQAVGYDLMSGTGEAWPHLLKAFPDIQKITAVDISSGMHEKAMSRLHKERSNRIDFIRDNVFDSGLKSNSADFTISTFGLKTFTPKQHIKLAKLVADVLMSGGKAAFIEASDPKGWIFRPLYNFYLHKILPLVERIFLKGAQDFAMIGQYTRNFQDASGFADALRAAGLEVKYKRFMFGCASGVIAVKP